MDIENLKRANQHVTVRLEESLDRLMTLFDLKEKPAGTDVVVVVVVEDIVFVAIHCNYATSANNGSITEIGISTLDTRKLSLPLSLLQGKESLRVIESNNYRQSSQKSVKFLFGTSGSYRRENMRTLLEEKIFVKDAGGSPRRVVLVGHDLPRALSMMKMLGIDILEKRESSRFLGVLDTATLGTYSPLLLFPSTILAFRHSICNLWWQPT